MLPRPSEITINMDEFELVPEAKSTVSCCALNVSPKGIITLNKRLIANIKERVDSLTLGFAYHGEDKRIIVLFASDNPNYSFASSGSRKDEDFSQRLIENGISLPARYIVEWNESANAWVGILNREKEEDALVQTLKKTRAKNKVKQ